MCHAQNFWLTVLKEGNVEKLDETIKVNAIEDVINNLLAGSQQMLDTFTAYSNEDLLKLVSNKATTQARYGFILHAINHNTYHRGQIVTMLRQLGVEKIPATDFIVWSRRK